MGGQADTYYHLISLRITHKSTSQHGRVPTIRRDWPCGVRSVRRRRGRGQTCRHRRRSGSEPRAGGWTWAKKQLHLTEHVIKIGASSRSGGVKKAWEAAEISKRWEASTWAKKIAAREKRALVTDFERFKLMKAKQARNRLIATEMGKMRSALKKAGGKPKPKRVNRKPHLSAKAQLHA